jgi:hypothetical protein
MPGCQWLAGALLAAAAMKTVGMTAHLLLHCFMFGVAYEGPRGALLLAVHPDTVWFAAAISRVGYKCCGSGSGRHPDLSMACRLCQASCNE